MAGNSTSDQRSRPPAAIKRSNALPAIGAGILSIFLAAAVAIPAKGNLRHRHQEIRAGAEDHPPIYLPEVKYVRLLTLGFNRLASDLLWFNTLNYFGKQFQRHGSLEWFSHMCRLVTDLNGRAVHAYEFCSTLLSWIAKEPRASAELLSGAIENDPNYWRYYYLRGFNYFYFLGEPRLAQVDFARAASLPEAPPFLASLASRLIASNEDPSAAVDFLKEILAQTEDPSAKEALGEKLQLAQISNDIKILERLAASYQENTGQKLESLEQLVEAKYLPAYPLDPFKKRYRYHPESGRITSESGKEGLVFKGKTAQTGLAGKFDGWRSE